MIDADFRMNIPQDADFPDGITVERDPKETLEYLHPGILSETEKELEELSHRLEMANDGWAIAETENRKLRYVMETAQTMRDDYECYECAPDGRYDKPLHCTEILKDFDDAVKAVNGG